MVCVSVVIYSSRLVSIATSGAMIPRYRLYLGNSWLGTSLHNLPHVASLHLIPVMKLSLCFVFCLFCFSEYDATTSVWDSKLAIHSLQCR